MFCLLWRLICDFTHDALRQQNFELAYGSYELPWPGTCHPGLILNTQLTTASCMFWCFFKPVCVTSLLSRLWYRPRHHFMYAILQCVSHTYVAVVCHLLFCECSLLRTVQRTDNKCVINKSDIALWCSSVSKSRKT